ncbi:hypothetical protein HK102_013870 [Quaeritorhiza haematococci]|nr:hypothetical protein HK102_013870 [Quaeritorhiza haematococci]
MKGPLRYCIVLIVVLAAVVGRLNKVCAEYVQPTVEDARSPCPLLNAFANHGILHHSGKDIDKTSLYNALTREANVGSMTAWILVSGTFRLAGKDAEVTSEDGKIKTERRLSLEDLNTHGLIEHDASLTRSDAALGDSVKVNETLVEILLSYSEDGENITADDLARYRRFREDDSAKRNKDLKFGLFEKFLSYGESSLLLNIMGKDGKIPIEVAREFLLHERLPNGWTKPETPKGQLDLGKYLFEIGWKTRSSSSDGKLVVRSPKKAAVEEPTKPTTVSDAESKHSEL